MDLVLYQLKPEKSVLRATEKFCQLYSIYTKAWLTNGSEEVRVGIRKRQQKSKRYGIPDPVECHHSTAVTSPSTYERNKVGEKSLFTRELNLPSGDIILLGLPLVWR